MNEPDQTPNSQSPIDETTRRQIEHLLLTKKKININDVAALSGVSKKTVSRIINNAPNVSDFTRAVVSEIIRLSGFRPDPQARGLAFRKSFLIGLIYDNPNAQYVVNMQTGILDQLKGTGYELVVHPCERKNAQFLDQVRDFIERQKLAGVIILPPIAEDLRLIEMLSSLKTDFIRITARKGEDNRPSIHTSQIVSNDQLGCFEAASHLAQIGHQRIGYIGGNPLYPSAQERRLGFTAGLKHHGLKIDSDLDFDGDYSFESGYQNALKLLKATPRPTAIIACNDEMAAGTYKAAYELGLSIPQSLSVISFDDSPLASRLTPGLSSVRLPTYDMARKAAQCLVAESGTIQSYFFDSTLILRQSTAKPLKP